MIEQSVSLMPVRSTGVFMNLRDDKSEIWEPNKWSLFGGHVEKGEMLIEALERELREELDIVLSFPSPICNVWETKSDGSKWLATIFEHGERYVDCNDVMPTQPMFLTGMPVYEGVRAAWVPRELIIHGGALDGHEIVQTHRDVACWYYEKMGDAI